MPAKKYTQEQIDKSLDLRERGLSYGQIRLRTGVHEKSVERYCRINGVDVPNPQTEYTGPTDYFRNGQRIKTFSAEEDSQIQKWDMQGVPRNEMARRLNRAHSSIRNRLASLARQDERRAA